MTKLQKTMWALAFIIVAVGMLTTGCESNPKKKDRTPTVPSDAPCQISGTHSVLGTVCDPNDPNCKPVKKGKR